MRASILPVIAAAFLATVTAKYTCVQNPGGNPILPYCVNMPDKIPADNDGGKLPTILYLGGSGTFGPPADIAQLTTYEGVGKLLKEFRNGNLTEVTRLAAQRFIVILPIAPYYRDGSTTLLNKHYDPLAVRNSFLHAAATYPVDLNRVYTVGYSGGCRGRVRHDEEFSAVSFVTARLCEIIRQHLAPSLMNELGGAEKAGSQYLVEHPYPETFTKLNRLINIPTRIYAGTLDTTAPTTPQKTYDELVRLGSKITKFFLLKNTHEGLQTEPWTAEMLKWLLSQKLTTAPRS